MKQALLLFLLLPAGAAAQHFEIGLNGGFTIHSLPAGNTVADQDKANAGYAAGARIDLLLPHSQIGIGVELAQLAQTSYLAPNYTIKVHDYPANPLTTPYAFYNFVHNGPNGYVYAGAMAGIAIEAVGVNTFNYNGTNITGYSTAYNSTFGYTAGIQAGVLIKAGKRIGINGEVGMRYTSFTYTVPNSTYTDNPYAYRLFYFPFTVGVRYRVS